MTVASTDRARPAVRFLGVVALAALLAACGMEAAAPLEVVMHKDPNCGCCGQWAAHLEANGFRVNSVAEADMTAVKARLGVPARLASCHTAEVGGYVIEGHVPAAAIRRLLKERPQATGLAVPGMPSGSPGMEVPGQKEPYEVVLFGPSAQAEVFERH